MTDTGTAMERKETRRDSTDSLGWAVVGEHGAVEFWVMEGSKELIGGVEYHHRAPMEYSSNKAEPDHADCPVLDGPCWHDGTSLWAVEHWIPGYAACGEGWVWDELEHTYRKWSQEQEETGDDV